MSLIVGHHPSLRPLQLSQGWVTGPPFLFSPGCCEVITSSHSCGSSLPSLPYIGPPSTMVACPPSLPPLPVFPRGIVCHFPPWIFSSPKLRPLCFSDLPLQCPRVPSYSGIEFCRSCSIPSVGALPWMSPDLSAPPARSIPSSPPHASQSQRLSGSPAASACTGSRLLSCSGFPRPRELPNFLPPVTAPSSILRPTV